MNRQLHLVLITWLNFLSAGLATAQTFSVLHSFTSMSTNASGVYTNSDGADPMAGLILSSNALYGTANGGGTSGAGTVFAINIDGTGFTNLLSFPAGAGNPEAGLAVSDNTLYGTANVFGMVLLFAINTDGSGYRILHFSGNANDGVHSRGRLTLAGGALCGTASRGGSPNNGAVFAVNTNGTGFTTLHSFTAGTGSIPNVNNSDGAYPDGGLTLFGPTLFGTATFGGSWGSGTVFALNTDGTGFTTLYTFTAGSGSVPAVTNNDGACPEGELTLLGNTLYGTTVGGGSSASGTVFAINIDGTGFTNLYTFSGGNDGAHPQAGLTSSGNTLYGTAYGGGSSGNGTVFAINTDGTGFTSLYSFGDGNDGAHPQTALILSGNTLYGTTLRGGSSGNGTVFSLSFRPQLTITPSGTNVILSWPLSYAGFSYAGYVLQETLNLGSTNGWTTVMDTNLPVIVDGQFRITRPMLGPQWSYRLKQL
jgi:uncharacterized repeat protein (TIGR03803 family)